MAKLVVNTQEQKLVKNDEIVNLSDEFYLDCFSYTKPGDIVEYFGDTFAVQPEADERAPIPFSFPQVGASA